MPTMDEAQAHSAAQQADLNNRWNEYMQMQQDLFNTLQAKQEVANIVQTEYSATNSKFNEVNFFASEWEKVVDKNSEIHHAQALGLDAPSHGAKMNDNLFQGQPEDWSWLQPQKSPFNQSPQDAAQEAEDLAKNSMPPGGP